MLYAVFPKLIMDLWLMYTFRPSISATEGFGCQAGEEEHEIDLARYW